MSRDRALEFLNGVLEVFPPSIDPVDDFEGYAVRRMALALREALLVERVDAEASEIRRSREGEKKIEG